MCQLALKNIETGTQEQELGSEGQKGSFTTRLYAILWNPVRFF